MKRHVVVEYCSKNLYNGRSKEAQITCISRDESEKGLSINYISEEDLFRSHLSIQTTGSSFQNL